MRWAAAGCDTATTATAETFSPPRMSSVPPSLLYPARDLGSVVEARLPVVVPFWPSPLRLSVDLRLTWIRPFGRRFGGQDRFTSTRLSPSTRTPGTAVIRSSHGSLPGVGAIVAVTFSVLVCSATRPRSTSRSDRSTKTRLHLLNDGSRGLAPFPKRVLTTVSGAATPRWPGPARFRDPVRRRIGVDLPLQRRRTVTPPVLGTVRFAVFNRSPAESCRGDGYYLWSRSTRRGGSYGPGPPARRGSPCLVPWITRSLRSASLAAASCTVRPHPSPCPTTPRRRRERHHVPISATPADGIRLDCGSIRARCPDATSVIQDSHLRARSP